MAHCGGTGVCAALGPFAPAQPSQVCIVLLEATSMRKKGSTQPSGGFAPSPSSYLLVQIALALTHYSQIEAWSPKMVLWILGTLFVGSIPCQRAVEVGVPLKELSSGFGEGMLVGRVLWFGAF